MIFGGYLGMFLKLKKQISRHMVEISASTDPPILTIFGGNLRKINDIFGYNL
jgi:hypothetical protein